MNLFMQEAVKQSLVAQKNDDVPVGAVIVCNNKIIAKSHNKKERSNDATNHAEILAISKACKKRNSWHLDDCELYVTLEPCEMCAAAIKQSRIKNVYSAISNDDILIHNRILDIFSKDKSNPQVNLFNDQDVTRGSKILSEFFNLTRNK